MQMEHRIKFDSKRVGIAYVSIFFSVLVGLLVFRVVKTSFASAGIEKNWTWPFLCLLLGVLFSIITRQQRASSVQRTMPKNFLVGIFLGFILAALFYFLQPAQRTWRGFEGIVFIPLAFQIFVSFAEEYLFRFQLQKYVQQTNSLPIAILAISFPFGFAHGLYNFFFQGSAYSWGWAIHSFVVSSAAGLAFGQQKSLARAFGLHLGYNLVVTFFLR